MLKNLEHEWATFVMRHLCSTNFFYHLLSVILCWLGIILFFATFNWHYCILYVLSGPVGSIGHIIGSDPGIDVREATSSPTAAFMATYMVLRVIVGQYPKDIRWAKEYYKNSEHTSPRAAAN
jgi:hypothetical protein